MNEIIVLTYEQLEEGIRRAVVLVSHDLVEMVKGLAPELMTKAQLAKYL